MATVSEEIKILIKATECLNDFEILYCEAGRDGEQPIFKQFIDVKLKKIEGVPKIILYSWKSSLFYILLILIFSYGG